MGEPPGDQYPAGAACPNCYGLGKEFGDESTPESVYLTFAGMLAPFVNANKGFVATQDAGEPCKWNFESGNFEGWWLWGEFGSLAFIALVDDPLCDFWFAGNICTLVQTAGAATCTIS